MDKRTKRKKDIGKIATRIMGASISSYDGIISCSNFNLLYCF